MSIFKLLYMLKWRWGVANFYYETIFRHYFRGGDSFWCQILVSTTPWTKWMFLFWALDSFHWLASPDSHKNSQQTYFFFICFSKSFLNSSWFFLRNFGDPMLSKNFLIWTGVPSGVTALSESDFDWLPAFLKKALMFSASCCSWSDSTCLMEGGAVRGNGGGAAPSHSTKLKVNVNVERLLSEPVSKAHGSDSLAE